LLQLSQYVPKFVTNIAQNSINNSYGWRGNVFEEKIKQMSLFLYIRGGSNLYNVLARNMALPSLKTLERYMLKYHHRLVEGELYFDELLKFLEKNNLPKCVSVTEDATKITEIVEVDSSNSFLLGLTSPFDPKTGMIYRQYFKASTAFEIVKNISNSKKAGYLYVILARSASFGNIFKSFNLQ
jgi:hypothetical protein